LEISFVEKTSLYGRYKHKENIREMFLKKEALWAVFSFCVKFHPNVKNKNKMFPVSRGKKVNFFGPDLNFAFLFGSSF
jgi:hypothetical protein